MTNDPYHQDLVRILEEVFGASEETLLEDVAQSIVRVNMAHDEVLLAPGESSNDLFIVVEGTFLELADEGSGKTRVVNRIGRGETMGESGLLSDWVRTTSVVAARDAILAKLSRVRFRNLAKQHPVLHEWLARSLSRKLHGIAREQSSDPLNVGIVVVPASPGAPLREFSQGLAERLKRISSCIVVSSAVVDTQMGRRGLAQTGSDNSGDLQVRRWLDEQEERYRTIIYVADPNLSNWSLRCIRRADEILLLGDAAGASEPGEMEEHIHGDGVSEHKTAGKSLVLLHAAGTDRPRGTAQWLRHRQVDRHFHLRIGSREDLDRLARYFSQQELGLVLSGGGSRGFAHFGIIKALHDSSLSVDCIGGVSMGALVAGLHASRDGFLDAVDRLRASLDGVFRDYTFPFVALTRGRRFDRFLLAVLGDADIEDLWLPYFCLSSNVTRAEPVIHASGPLWRAVRASSSLPGLVPPVVSGGDLLYDGGLLNNLPVDVMRERIRDGKLIAVDVVPPVDLHVQARMQAASRELGGDWRRMGRMIHRQTLPNIFAILLRSSSLGSVRLRRKLIEEFHVDLYLTPPVEDFNITDLGVVDEVMEVGNLYGEMMLKAWMESAKNGRG